ncbi:MAG: DHHW family protein [Oscillospiraceae bacterium]
MKDSIKKYPVVYLFFVFLFCFAILDAMWPKRQTSELENRELAQYPTITLEGVVSNKWMQSYEKYIKDQIVFRDEWIDIKSRCENMLLKTENNGVWFGKKDNVLFQKFISVTDKQLRDNTKFLSDFAARHPNMVSTMIVPSASLVWQDKLPFAAPVVNEGAYIDTMFKSLQDAGANVIDLRKAFEEHKDEQLYYRNDHHWTSDGAYIAYEEFAKSQKLVPFDKGNYKANVQEGFYGTNYSKSRYQMAVADSITWYDIPNTLTVHKMDAADTKTEMSIYNTEKWKTRDKYGAFLNGNNGYSTIKGSGQGSILIVKDSYANCFVPYLVDNYADIGIIDLRDTNAKLDQLIADEGYEHVLFLYNFQTFSSDTNLWKIKSKA